MAIVRADMADETKLHKQITDPSKNWVQDILDFENYKDYNAYTKNFKYEPTEFMSLFVAAVLQKLIYEKQQTTKYEIEDNVEVGFTTSLYLETIKMMYFDNRSNLRELKYQTVEPVEYFQGVKVHKEGDPANDGNFKYETHTVLNKPIYHSTKIYQKQHKDHPNKWIYDFDRTHKKFLEAFILFANVIDVEHEQMVWLMLKEAERKLEQQEFKNSIKKSIENEPTRPKPRTIID